MLGAGQNSEFRIQKSGVRIQKIEKVEKIPVVCDSRLTIHDSRFTILDSRLTIYDSRFSILDSEDKEDKEDIRGLRPTTIDQRSSTPERIQNSEFRMVATMEVQ
jgi:hypothetical protein